MSAVCFVLVNLVLHCTGLGAKRTLTQETIGDLGSAIRSGSVASWWFSHAYLNQKSAPDVLLFGSSQLGGLQAADAKFLRTPQDYVLDHKCVSVEKHLKEQNLPSNCFTIGIVGSMISDQYMIAKVLLNPENTPKVMVLTVSPRDFIDGYLASVTSTEVFRWFSPYLTNAVIGQDFLSDPIEKISWFTTSGLPIRKAFRHTHNDLETSEPDINNSDKEWHRFEQDPLLNTNTDLLSNLRPGQCIVSPEMPEFFYDNSSDYKKRYSKPSGPMYEHQTSCFNKMVADARSRGISVLVVGMPLDSTNQKLLSDSFWSDYHSRLKTACENNNAKLVDLSHDPDFGRGDFVDGVHLSARGGWKLAQRIAREIASAPNMVLALKSVDSQNSAKALAGGQGKETY
jgi:Protein of unknown function (DUF1574)